MTARAPDLPVTSPLVGREADLRAIDALLASGERLVTITGPGGVGKSRLALEVARRHLEAVREAGDEGAGVWRCDLSEAAGLGGACDAVAGALGVPAGEGAGEAGQGGERAVERLGRAIAAREAMLLVLDDFDPVVALAPRCLGRWLQLAPAARVLVTSRERMHLPGEVVHELRPLSLPGPGADLAGSEAVELFLRTAQRARPGWAFRDDEAPLLAEIVTELDGVPLALELAASRLSVMGLRALLHRLRQGFEVLRRTQRGGAARHETLADTIDWSWRLLAAWEQDALAQCAVFRGGFTLEAAEAVVSIARHKGAPPLVDVLQGLRSKSLLRAADAAGPDGELRLGMYAAVRQFATAELARSPRSREAEARHARYYVEAGARWAREAAAGDGAARRQLLVERDNLLSLAERVLRRGPVTVETAQPAIQALLLLAPVLLVHGPLETCAELLDPVLGATAGSGADPSLLGEALALRGGLRCHQGRQREGMADLVQALSLGRKLMDRRLEARAELGLAEALADTGTHDEARQHGEAALRAAQTLDDREAEARARCLLGKLEARLGRLDAARRGYQEALEALAAGGGAGSGAESAARRLLGELHLAEGRRDQALAYFESSAALSRALEDRRGEGLAAGLIALVRHDDGQHGQAQAGYAAAIDLLAEHGFRGLEGVAVGRLGVLCQEQGRLDEAEAHLGRACEQLGEGGDVEHRGLFLAHLGGVRAEAGRVEQARVALAAAAASFSGSGSGPGAAAAVEHPFALAVELQAALLDPARAPAVAARARGVAARSFEARLALRCLEAALGRSASRPRPEVDPRALVIGAEARWCRPPHAEPVDLERRRPLRLMLERLARHRLDQPGEPLPWEGLLEAGWPGERVIPSAGAHRVRVAVSTLRKLGLRAVLLTVDDGYMLDPAVPVELQA